MQARHARALVSLNRHGPGGTPVVQVGPGRERLEGRVSPPLAEHVLPVQVELHAPVQRQRVALQGVLAVDDDVLARHATRPFGRAVGMLQGLVAVDGGEGHGVRGRVLEEVRQPARACGGALMWLVAAAGCAVQLAEKSPDAERRAELGAWCALVFGLLSP